jgi:hypothetical protein
MNVANLKALLRECEGEGGCAQAIADMLELHSLMARRANREKEDGLLTWVGLPRCPMYPAHLPPIVL